MRETLPVHRMAAALVAARLGIGLVPFALLAALHPATHRHTAYLLGILIPAAWALWLLLLPGKVAPQQPGQTPLRRLLAGLLLGSALSAIPFQHHGSSLTPVILGMGLVIRWGLFALESIDIQRAYRQQLPSPGTAMRLRRTCTMITGAVIPLLLWCGAPGHPLLWISFTITLLCQWSQLGEACHSRIHHGADSFEPYLTMSEVHGEDGWDSGPAPH